MSKYKSGNFTQINRKLFKSDLSWRAKWLYVVLSELEHQFTDDKGKDDFFYRDQKGLAKDTGMSVKTNIKSRRELEESGWIKSWRMHWVDPETGKKSEKHVTAFRFLK